MKSLMTVIVCSAALSACTGIKMENFENKKSTHEQQEENFHIKTNRTKDVTDNNNNAKKLGIQMENFGSIKIPENKKLRYVSQKENFLGNPNKTKDIIENDNNARKLDTKIKSFESAKIFEHKKSRHEQKEENFHRKINKTKDIIENNGRKQDTLYRNNTMSFPPYNASYAF